MESAVVKILCYNYRQKIQIKRPCYNVLHLKRIIFASIKI